MRGRPLLARDLGESFGVRRVVRADDEHDIGPARELLHRVLPVLGRVADVLARRTLDRREPFAEDLYDLVRLVDRQRGLREVREVVGIDDAKRPRLGDVLHEDRSIRRLPGRSDDLLVAGVTDQHDGPVPLREPACLEVHLGHERTRCVEDRQPAGRGVLVYHRSDAVSREHDDGALGNLGLLVDEDRALALEIADHVRVVHDLLSNVDRGPVRLKGAFDGLDGAFDAGTVAARGGEKDLGGHDLIVPTRLPNGTARGTVKHGGAYLVERGHHQARDRQRSVCHDPDRGVGIERGASKSAERAEEHEHVRSLLVHLREGNRLVGRSGRELPLGRDRRPFQLGQRRGGFGDAQDLQRPAHRYSQSRPRNTRYRTNAETAINARANG